MKKLLFLIFCLVLVSCKDDLRLMNGEMGFDSVEYSKVDGLSFEEIKAMAETTNDEAMKACTMPKTYKPLSIDIWSSKDGYTIILKFQSKTPYGIELKSTGSGMFDKDKKFKGFVAI